MLLTVMRYVVHLTKWLKFQSEGARWQDYYLKKEVTFPFMPFPGMTIRQADGFMYSCIQVTWNEQDNSLAIWAEDEKIDADRFLHEYQSISNMVEYYKSLGWPEAKKVPNQNEDK
jgi:hypothetical protein